MSKNNFGFVDFKLAITLLVLGYLVYEGYYFYINNLDAFQQIGIKKEENNSKESSKNLEYNESEDRITIKDNKNNYTFEIDTSKSYSFPSQNSEQVLTDIKKSVIYEKNEKEHTFTLGFNPNQRIILSEGTEYYYVSSINGNFIPQDYWKEYINNKDFNFKFREISINGFKAYTTADEPGRSLNVTTVVVINPNHYVIFGYIPYMADATEFNNPNYSLTNSNIPVIQNYFDIINSIKKVN